MAYGADAQDREEKPLRYSDDDLLRMVGDERKRSVGFGDGGGDLTAARERAINYYNGDVSQDIPSKDRRSAAVSTDVAEAVETVLPDLIEIFTGGDDVATFNPQGKEDEAAAQEETDYVNHVVFTENAGFLIFYTAFKDALLVRTGLFHWFWEEEAKEETAAQVTAEMAPMAQALAAQAGVELETEEQADGSVALKTTKLQGKACIMAVPPEDFTVAADTVNLRDTTYCAMRERTRVQNLISRGIDADKARGLPHFGAAEEAINQARDRAGESERGRDGNGMDDLRTVEVRAHYIRLDADGDGKLAVWRIITDAEEKTLIDKERVDGIPFGAITPYLNPHRFHGLSVADLLLEIQRIKTTLLRMLLDSGYFALNQRTEVATGEGWANEFTLSDLLRNEPNSPVRVNKPGTVTPLSAGALAFDVFGALEHVSVMGEQRTGIVRNAQGLAPDTLHDTARGALALISAAQKRVRLIARVFAETGIKDLFLGVHALLRKSYSEDHAPATAKLGNDWKQVQPQAWSERGAMTVHVGVGSAGREHDLMVATQGLEIMKEVIALQGGAEGPIVTLAGLYQQLKKWSQAANQKSPELYWQDPAQAAPQEPKPDPEAAKAQAELQLRAQSAQADQQLAQGRAQAELQLQATRHDAEAQAAERKAARDHELAVMRIEGELRLKRETTAAELQMKRDLLNAELQMKREVAMMNAQVAHETGMARAQSSGSVSEVEPGGDPG